MKANVALVALAMIATACSETPRTTGPRLPNPPGREIADGSTGLGNSHFFWLPPTYLTTPSYSGSFDGTLVPTVTVCEWTGNVCGATVAHFSVNGGTGGTRLAVDPKAETYGVTWDTRQCDLATSCPLDAAKQYRMRVTAPSLTGQSIELGHADVDVVDKVAGVVLVDRTQYVPLVDAKKFPIAFRLEAGIVGAVQVTPALVSVEACQATQLAAQVLDLHGQPLNGRSVFWGSADPTVVSVDANGRISGQGNGGTTIYATADGVTGSASAT